MYNDTNAAVPPTLVAEVSELIERRAKAKAKKAKKKLVDWRSKNRGRTAELQTEIHGWLDIIGEGFTVKALAELVGISRQLMLYHLKKMAATRQLVMALEPCEVNGGLQFHVWANGVAAAHFLARVAA